MDKPAGLFSLKKCIEILLEYSPYYIQGMLYTLILAIISIAIGFVFALLLAVIRRSHRQCLCGNNTRHADPGVAHVDLLWSLYSDHSTVGYHLRLY